MFYSIILLSVIIFTIWCMIPNYDKCYKEMENKNKAKNKCCYGLAGGTRSTDYLSESCIDCPYLVLK